MSLALLALKRAILAALSQDGELAAAMNGVRLYDHPPPAARFPYLTFGAASVHDWATATEPGSEILITLHVWSRSPGSSQALAIAGRVGVILDSGGLGLDGHDLVGLRLLRSETDYAESAEVHHVALTLRAVAEPSA